MTTILFPTRGGEASYPNQDRVIALCKEEDARLVFMYVADVRFMNLMARPAVVDLQDELEEMGAFMLAMAKERAAGHDVQAETIVRRGVFRQAVKEVIAEEGVTLLAIGAPTEATGVTTPTYRQSLIRELIEETAIDVVVLDEGEIVARYGPDTLPDED